MSLKEIRLHAQIMLHSLGSIVNRIERGRGLCDHLMSTTIFTSIINHIFIWAPKFIWGKWFWTWFGLANHLALITGWVHVSYPMRSGCSEKKFHLRHIYLRVWWTSHITSCHKWCGVINITTTMSHNHMWFSDKNLTLTMPPIRSLHIHRDLSTHLKAFTSEGGGGLIPRSPYHIEGPQPTHK